MSDHNDDSNAYPKLGQWFHVIAQPSGTTWLIRILIGLCAVFMLWDLTYEKHGYMEMERVFAFYAGFGFIAFSIVIFGAKALRKLTQRDEDFYAPNSVDTEEYPDKELKKEVHDA